MALHKHYDHVRLLVDRHFMRYRRRAVAAGLEHDRIELWHNLLEAALAANAVWSGEALTPEWQTHVLSGVDQRLSELELDAKG